MRSLILAVLLTGAVSSAAWAEGALAVGGGRYGISADKHDRHQADRRAEELCGVSDCRVVMNFVGECAAIAYSRNGARGWARGENRERAGRHAVEQCHSQHGHDCEVAAVECDRR